MTGSPLERGFQLEAVYREAEESFLHPVDEYEAYFRPRADLRLTPVFDQSFFSMRHRTSCLEFAVVCRLGLRHVVNFRRLDRFRWIVEADFRAFLAEIEVLDQPGSAYFHLWRMVCGWGWRRGFSIPMDYPWDKPDPEILCSDAAGFPRNLTESVVYRLASRKVLDGKLRVRDDRNRLSWFPLSCFDLSRLDPPTRRWVHPDPAVPDFWQTETRPFAEKEP